MQSIVYSCIALALRFKGRLRLDGLVLLRRLKTNVYACMSSIETSPGGPVLLGHAILDKARGLLIASLLRVKLSGSQLHIQQQQQNPCDEECLHHLPKLSLPS